MVLWHRLGPTTAVQGRANPTLPAADASRPRPDSCYRTPIDSLSHMYRPLNGVRTALVIMAAIAGIAAAFLGQYLVTAVLAAGVAVHGVGWWYLSKQSPE